MGTFSPNIAFRKWPSGQIGYGGECMRFQLVTTDHLSEGVWFRDIQDFIVAMNLVAIVTFVTRVPVLAFVLMSNHIHFVLQCEKAEAFSFINEYKRRYSQYLSKRYHVKEYLRKNGVDVQDVKIEDESLERAIAYVLMNPVAANICLNAGDYPWGSGNSYFKLSAAKGTELGALSRRKQMALLHSNENLPGRIMVGEDGYILPESYIPVKFVESLFRTPKRMNYFLLNSSKAKRRMSSSETGVPSFRDHVVIAAVQDLCASLYRKTSVKELSGEDLVDIVWQVRRRFSADINQIARILGLSYSEVISLLESF